MATEAKKLSHTQLDVLEYAEMKPRQDARAHTLEDGWFYPQHTTRGSIDFFCRWQTCASLCGLGLLEYRVDLTYMHKGRVKDFKSYRITDAGRQYLAEHIYSKA